MINLINQKDFNTLKSNLIVEKININKYNKSYNKILKELNINFYFITTFGTSIVAYFPIFEELVKNSNLNIKLSQSDIILLSICALAVLFNENKQNITKLKSLIEEKGYLELLQKFIDFITNINLLFKMIAKNTGKSLITLIDMFSYTALYVPFLLGLFDLIELYNVGLDTFTQTTTTSGLLISTGIGVLTISIKHFLKMLIKKINRLSKKNNLKETIYLDFSNLI